MTDLIERARLAVSGYSDDNIAENEYLSFAHALIAAEERRQRVEAAAAALADAVYHERNMPRQDIDLQMKAGQAVDEALANFRDAMDAKP